MRAAPARSASAPKTPSTTSSAPISRTSWTAALRRSSIQDRAGPRDGDRLAKSQVLNRRRNPDPLFFHAVPQRQQHGPAHIGHALDRIIDPEAQDEIERFAAESDEMANRRGLSHHAR